MTTRSSHSHRRRGCGILLAALVLAGLAAPLPAQDYDFFHGTDYESAQRILNSRLTPWSVQGLHPEGGDAPWSPYTDFGKGFYTHVPGQFELAREWAARKTLDTCRPGQREARWGVVVFRVDPELLRPIDQGEPARALYFRGKADRPWNAPWSWLQFIEINRHREEWGQAGIARPGDYDWSEHYAWIQGPIWVPRDSGVDAGGEPIPEYLYQRNWLQQGLDWVLNQPRTERFLVDGTVPCTQQAPPPPQPQEGYAVFLAKNDVLVGLRHELEATPSCRLAGWGIDCDTTVGQAASLHRIAGPFATREDAAAWFCANIVPGTHFRPPLARFLQGAQFRFDGEKHMISNGPRCP